jgi:phosphoribulokinase
MTLWLSGTINPLDSQAIQTIVWDEMRFADHLRTKRLGEFTIGTELHRSETLAITQLLVLYQLVKARAAIVLGARGIRADQMPQAPKAPSQGPQQVPTASGRPPETDQASSPSTPAPPPKPARPHTRTP